MRYISSESAHGRGFTLIELLVTLGIISVLALLVFSGTKGAQATAQSAACASKLRQQGAAFMAYASDHSGRLPLSWNGTNDADNNWWYHLTPYLGLNVEKSWPEVIRACQPNAPLGCPSTKVGDSGYPLPWASYTMPQSQRSYLANIGNSNGEGVLLSIIRRPATSLLVAEGHHHPDFNTWRETPHGTGFGTGTTFGLSFPHNKKMNALFVDGHVQAMSSEDLERNWNVYYDYLNNL